MTTLIAVLRRTLSSLRLAGAGLGLLGGLSLPTASLAQADTCPPPPAAPTAEQIQEGARQARDRGFLWRIGRDGRSGWLYGTVHVGRLAWLFPGPQLRAALDSADTLALEIDVTDPAIGAAVASAIRAPADWPPLPGPLKARLAAQAQAACLPDRALDGLHPVMQALTLTAMAGRRDGLEAAFAQEAALGSMARAKARRLVSLETVAQQMQLLIPSEPARAFDLVDHTLAQLEQGRSRSLLLRLARIWEQGELDELGQYERRCECVESEADRAQLRRLNDERNPALAAGIEALHVQGRTVLAAVGALHMVGAQGLPALLRQRGFTVERVRPGSP